MAQTEAQYQTQVLKKIRKLFPGCHILKNDSGYQQGVPDWSIYWNRNWGMLEIKRNKSASVQPNQEYYVQLFDGLSFARFLYPENEEEVLREMELAFAS